MGPTLSGSVKSRHSTSRAVVELQPGYPALHASTVAPQDVEQVVGVLVLATAVERERLEHDLGASLADPDVPLRLLAKERAALERHPLPVAEGAPEAGGDDGGEVRNANWARAFVGEGLQLEELR
jgi:hypothetical protein